MKQEAEAIPAILDKVEQPTMLRNKDRGISAAQSRATYHKVSLRQLVTYVQPLTAQKKSQTFLITISLQCSLFLKRTKRITA